MVFKKDFLLLKQCLLGDIELFAKEEINEIDHHKNTPLLLAGKLSINDPDYLAAVQILIEGGANITIRDEFGQKLGDIARQMNSSSLYSLFFKANNERRKLKWFKKRIIVLD